MARPLATGRAMRPGSVRHDEVIVAARGARARCRRSVPASGGRPAVQLHQAGLGAAAVEPGVAEVVPEPVRVDLHARLVAAPLDHLVDPGAGERATLADPEPQP